MKNIHVIPSRKPIGIHFLDYHITSSEEIKEGDWFYLYDADIIAKYVSVKPVVEGKKIILTTNVDLIADGVQAIDDEFLQWFVKNPTCEEVEVKKGFADGTDYGYNFLDYKIIIPIEETKQETLGYICPQTKKQCDDECCVSAKDCHVEAGMGIISDSKQETIEEAAERLVNRPYGNVVSKSSFIEGAAVQAKRMYSEEDMIEFMQYIVSNQELEHTSSVSKDTAKYYLEQFKKQKS
jgi:hypothetical protein